MRFESALLASLLGAAAALPQGQHQQQTEQQPCLPGGECPFDMCTIEYKPTEGDQNTAKIHWEQAGAQKLLERMLNNQLENWSDQINNEINGGQAYNCIGFPGTTCSGQEQCSDYSSTAAYYVHVSMANMYSAFIKIHEAIQDDGITNLASGIKQIVDVFGPPPPSDDSFIWSLLIGAFVSAAALAGPMWQVGAPMTGIVGALNVGAGVEGSQPETPLDYERDLEVKLGEFYSGFQKNLEKSVGALFGGRLDELESYDGGDQVAWIAGSFRNGKLLNSHLVNEAVDGYIGKVKQMIQRGFVVSVLKHQDYYVSQRWDITQDECGSQDPTAIWMNDRCTSIAIDKGAPMTGTFPNRMEEEKYDAFINDPVAFDYQAAMQNAIDCAANGGGDPDLIKWHEIGLEYPGGMPPCFFNLKVRDQDFYGIPPEPEDLE